MVTHAGIRVGLNQIDALILPIKTKFGADSFDRLLDNMQGWRCAGAYDAREGDHCTAMIITHCTNKNYGIIYNNVVIKPDLRRWKK